MVSSTKMKKEGTVEGGNPNLGYGFFFSFLFKTQTRNSLRPAWIYQFWTRNLKKRKRKRKKKRKEKEIRGFAGGAGPAEPYLNKSWAFLEREIGKDATSLGVPKI